MNAQVVVCKFYSTIPKYSMHNKLLYLHGMIVRPTDDILLHAEHS